jgi:hypothetical protein
MITSSTPSRRRHKLFLRTLGALLQIPTFEQPDSGRSQRAHHPLPAQPSPSNPPTETAGEPIKGLAISPDERWLASSSDEAISIWPMPDVMKPPLHTLSLAELLARLDALTNVRVVRDPASATGWKEEIGPFPGWKDVPTW